MTRANYIGAPEFYDLNAACRTITEAYGHHLYLVGSALKKRDFRDVDLRLILPDAQFDALFPGMTGGWWLDARWSLMCSSISLWLTRRSALPIDFQIQRQSDANRDEPDGQRSAIGIFLEPKAKPNST